MNSCNAQGTQKIMYRIQGCYRGDTSKPVSGTLKLHDMQVTNFSWACRLRSKVPEIIVTINVKRNKAVNCKTLLLVHVHSFPITEENMHLEWIIFKIDYNNIIGWAFKKDDENSLDIQINNPPCYHLPRKLPYVFWQASAGKYEISETHTININDFVTW